MCHQFLHFEKAAQRATEKAGEDGKLEVPFLARRRETLDKREI